MENEEPGSSYDLGITARRQLARTAPVAKTQALAISFPVERLELCPLACTPTEKGPRLQG
jgi:hypothetical protein